MVEQDLDRVAALEAELQSFPWSRGNFHDSLKVGHSVWVCLLGGELPDGPGFFYPATVLDQISPTCRVWREETFGPVASVLRANSDLDAIRLANDTPFGLGASIYSADVERAQALAAELEVGSVFINRHTSSDLRLPFGGVKASGYGRELSEFGLYEFVNVKTYWQR
jgi:succinate-semialdehyde dehydrogenase/glutarate-semialdehyde dehydrogenase/succinate-semialdehyde dehydrogenase